MKLRRLNSETDTRKPFDCGDTDLNGFLLDTDGTRHNATMHACEMLSETYVLTDDNDDILAYFSLLNDKIEREYSDCKIWNRLSRKIPNAKRRSSHPALKIGRLAIATGMQNTGLGSMLLGIIQRHFFENRKTGCRFITADALRDAVPFYRKNNFSILKEPQPGDDTVAMYFDLKSLVSDV